MKTELIQKSRAKTAFGLLSEVRKLIIAEPQRYDQRRWLDRESESVTERPFPPCGTIGCVAGWVATLKGPTSFDWMQSGIIAQDILGLNDQQELELFDETAAKGLSGSPVHARSGAKHIASFQKKYRAQLLAKKV